MFLPVPLFYVDNFFGPSDESSGAIIALLIDSI